ncbi:Ser/Thr protein kinase RdoA (MazF antagonist) [Bacillus mesophilus]|uniref:Phosphotransferase n=1 Tax=Bacillus mesophilus TaxID=1808955 RepID=A0A6M0Q4Z9_9BACI|nr:phosphotransferase [Bacillus mesophilus]MBM7659642.1 Ser/Thr protein kinase RdoA (MazF antagonist) [Bacillus mesophilus]NEY70510.1 phosphotransferase [Bacillus mesophilus]
MEQSVDRLFSEDLVHKAGQGYGADTKEYRKLGDFESYIFEVSYHGKPTILRLTHSSHRSPGQIEAELEWVNYLHQNGVNVSKPYSSSEGSYVVTLPVEGSFFYASLFEKAPGNRIEIQSEMFNDNLFYEWGRTTGQLHRLTTSFEPSGVKRPQWDEEELLYPEKVLPFTDLQFNKVADQLVHTVKSLPKSKETYGLIHSDIHSGNFFLHEGKLQLFDFDDSQYFWFVHDIAIPIYYSAWYKFQNGNKQERTEFSKVLLEQFLKGYEKEFHIDHSILKKLPLFLNLRDLVLFNVFHKKMDVENANERFKALLGEIKGRILSQDSIVDLNV